MCAESAYSGPIKWFLSGIHTRLQHIPVGLEHRKKAKNNTLLKRSNEFGLLSNDRQQKNSRISKAITVLVCVQNTFMRLVTNCANSAEGILPHDEQKNYFLVLLFQISKFVFSSFLPFFSYCLFLF